MNEFGALMHAVGRATCPTNQDACSSQGKEQGVDAAALRIAPEESELAGDALKSVQPAQLNCAFNAERKGPGRALPRHPGIETPSTSKNVIATVEHLEKVSRHY